MVILVSGPCRSGKSKWAENLMKDEDNVIYIATSNPHPEDKSWRDRIQKHKDRRPKHWQLIESHLDIVEQMPTLNKLPILIDSLGGFVCNHLGNDQKCWDGAVEKLIIVLKEYPSKIVIVAEETGWGVSPVTESGNLFRDRMGTINQDIANISDQIWLVINSRAIDITNNSIPIR